MNKRILIIFTIALFVSCSKKPIQIVSAESAAVLSTNGLVYALPRTVLKIKVDAIKTTIVPGPYCRFAQKYLGILDVPVKKVDEWRISNVDVSTALESDPSALYAATPGDDTKIDFLKIYSKGLIIPISGFGVSSTTIKDIKTIDTDGETYFTDLSISPFIASEKTTYYSKIKHDSVFVRVPIQKEMIVEKNVEEKARDAADYIFMLRKRRSDFLSVDADHNLNGEGLKIALDEISRLEHEYLSLFIGKSFNESSTHFFEYVPNQVEGESSILFRFSGVKGVLASSDLSGNPILLKTLPESIPESYDIFFRSISMEKDKPLKEVIYYRIPTTTVVSLSDGKAELLTRRISICQYGPLVRMPIKYMVKDSDLIEFSGVK
ncbi:MAG: DUF4831 family protein [Bacteroidales bacterium]|nr:MAG: DUF4831 family protein [Bacteroidales bacterium]